VNEDAAGEVDLVRVVLGDPNVLYSRVLRDYLLYAANEEIISIAWTGRILDEVTRHLIANVQGFTEESGKRLVSGMNAAFPYDVGGAVPDIAAIATSARARADSQAAEG
jgi:hypothetical protein